MADDLNLIVAQTGFIVAAATGMYTLSSACLGRLTRFLKLENINLLGTVVLGLGFVGVGSAPNFTMLMMSVAVYGVGMGMIDSSINTYMAKYFTARHMNWLHCFWGGGAMISPLIVSQIALLLSWRAGYYTLAGILGAVSLVILVSIYKGIWIKEKVIAEETNKITVKKRYLTKKWHQTVEISTCFVLGGMDYSLVFFTGIVLAARGMNYETIALYPTVYYVCMTAGRVAFGWLAKWLKDITAIRIGLAAALLGVLILQFTGNISGIALAGLGLAPVFPSLLHDTSNRFKPRILAKLVGYEVAAYGAGMGILFFAMSQVLNHISLETLFPMSMGLILFTFILNEILEVAVKRTNVSRHS
jgi:MFS family permease